MSKAQYIELGYWILGLIALAAAFSLGAFVCDILEKWEHKRRQDKLVRQNWKVR